MGADRELGRRLTAAIAYLLRLQASSGAWTDFWLPVGTSDAWATAFVGLGMHAASGSPVLDPQVRQEALSAAQRAAAWLLAQPRPHGGWGYNSQVAPDADSTAHSLSLLARLGLPAPAEAIAFLLSCRTWSDVDAAPGGFRTYTFSDPENPWAQPHAGVTAAALRALFDLGRLSRAELAAEWAHLLVPAQRLDGGWDGYWWTSPAYATGMALEARAQSGSPLLARPVRLRRMPLTAFDEAWALHAYALLGDEQAVHRLARRLLSRQDSDGGWPSAPVLRVPPSHPGARGLDDLQATDARRLFATSSALRALALHAGMVEGALLSPNRHPARDESLWRPISPSALQTR